MPTYSTPIPGVGGYGQSSALANLAYQQAMAQLIAKRAQLLSQYGYTAQYDPTSGAMTSMGVDPWNPYGQYQVLLAKSAASSMEAEQERIARGLSQRGLGAQADTRSQWLAGAESSALGHQFGNDLLDIENAMAQAGYENQNARAQARLDAARSAISAGAFNPGSVPALDMSILDQLLNPSYGEPLPTSTSNTQKKKSIIVRNGQTMVLWGGKYRTAAGLKQYLKAHGVPLKTFVKNHPAAAAALGLK